MLPPSSKANWRLRASVSSQLLFKSPFVAMLLLLNAFCEGGHLELFFLNSILSENACSVGILTVLLTNLAAEISPLLKIVLRQFEILGEQFLMFFQQELWVIDKLPLLLLSSSWG